MRRIRKMARMLALASFLLSPSLAHGTPPEGDALFSPDGYRIAHYRGPVRPVPLEVDRIAARAAAQLGESEALFIDVLPAEGGHRDAEGTWHLAMPHSSIAGARWFPEAGRGTLTPDIARWFARGIQRLTGGRKDRMIVTFCLADCWMSWNAARRLRALGYTNIWWLAEGTDGWRELGLPLVDARPEGP